MTDVLTTPAGALAAVLVGCVLAAWIVLGERRRRARLAHDLACAQSQVDTLAAQVDQLARQIASDRSAEHEQQRLDREYVITSLGEAEERPGGAVAWRWASESGPVPRPKARFVPDPPAVIAERVEERLVSALARERAGSPVRAGAAELALRGMALAAGVRHALSADVRDRAAAEAQVASRRSRRVRKHELRAARRQVREARLRETGRAETELAETELGDELRGEGAA